jgi:transcriptional regulator with XRE-family HTH domain
VSYIYDTTLTTQIIQMPHRSPTESVLLTRTRQALGIDQELMGGYIGASRQMVSMIEKGRRNLKLGQASILLNLDIWLNPETTPDESGTLEWQAAQEAEAAQWLNARKDKARVMLELKQFELRAMQKDYARSREIVNRLNGPAPAGISKPLPVRWKQRVMRVHERIMKQCGPVMQMKYRLDIAALEAALSVS